MKRRRFIRTSIAAGTAAGMGSSPAPARKPVVQRRRVVRDLLSVGMVGCGPYSLTAPFTRIINDFSVPPRTQMQVTAVWKRDDDYRTSFRGSDDFVERQVSLLRERAALGELVDDFGVREIVDDVHDMPGMVDAVCIMDPDRSLELAAPFIRAKKPVYIAPPVAWTMNECRELVSMARQEGVPLITGSYVPWLHEFRSAAARVDRERLQHLYVDGPAGGYVASLSHLLETAGCLTGMKAFRCMTHGVSWDRDIDPAGVPPLMVHVEYESGGDTPVHGALSAWRGVPYRHWAKVHSQSEVVETAVFEPDDGDGVVDYGDSLYLPLLREIGRTFETGVSPVGYDDIINQTAIMLAAHRSGVEDGMPVHIDDVSRVRLPGYHGGRET